MNDQIPAVTDDDRRRAYEWAKSVEANLDTWGGRLSAPARVILNAVPTPPRPTLADMTDDERAACLRMQCDTAPNRSVRGFIADIYPGGCRIIERDTWEWRSCSDDMVTPRPDLPRMEWPADEEAEDGPPVKAGTVIESADDARIPALPVGSVLLDREGEEVTRMGKGPDTWDGPGYIPIAGDGTEYGPWTVARLPKKSDPSDAVQEVDAVPESTLAVGSVWHDVDALTRACRESGRDQITVTDRDGDVSVWGADERWWATGAPDYGFEPYTILHDGKKAHQ